MTRKQRFIIHTEIASLSDSDLKRETLSLMFDTLGSCSERMYDLGYDIVDIVDYEKYKKFISEKADLYESFCIIRGIDLFSE